MNIVDKKVMMTTFLGSLVSLFLVEDVMAQDCFKSLEKHIYNNYEIVAVDTSYRYRPVFKKKEKKKHPNGKLNSETRMYQIEEGMVSFNIKKSADGVCSFTEIIKNPNDSTLELQGRYSDHDDDGKWDSKKVKLTYHIENNDSTLSKQTETYNLLSNGRVSYTNSKMYIRNESGSVLRQYISESNDGTFEIETVNVSNRYTPSNDNEGATYDISIPYDPDVFNIQSLPIKDNYKQLPKNTEFEKISNDKHLTPKPRKRD